MEDTLVKEYIGKNADKIIKGEPNWIAAILGQLFGPIWFFYRKSFLIGLLFFMITFFVGYICNIVRFPQAYFVIFLIYLFTANKLYVWDVKRKVSHILATNKTTLESDLIKIAQKKGKPSVAVLVIYIIILVLSFLLMLWMIFLLIINSIPPFLENLRVLR